MKASNYRVVYPGNPLFEKLKSQMRPDLQVGLNQITLIGGGADCDVKDCEGCGLPEDECDCGPCVWLGTRENCDGCEFIEDCS